MITTKEWGPKLWYALHTITFNYPENPTLIDKQNYETFFISLKHVLPCIICQKHYATHLEKHPINQNLSDRISLSKWLVNVHNEVNIMLGKPIMSFEEVVKLYKNEKTNNYTYYIKLTTLMIIIILILYFLKKNNYFFDTKIIYKYK